MCASRNELANILYDVELTPPLPLFDLAPADLLHYGLFIGGLSLRSGNSREKKKLLEFLRYSSGHIYTGKRVTIVISHVRDSS